MFYLVPSSALTLYPIPEPFFRTVPSTIVPEGFSSSCQNCPLLQHALLVGRGVWKKGRVVIAYAPISAVINFEHQIPTQDRETASQRSGSDLSKTEARFDWDEGLSRFCIPNVARSPASFPATRTPLWTFSMIFVNLKNEKRLNHNHQREKIN